jgi:hypothetical protein
MTARTVIILALALLAVAPAQAADTTAKTDTASSDYEILSERCAAASRRARCR